MPRAFDSGNCPAPVAAPTRPLRLSAILIACWALSCSQEPTSEAPPVGTSDESPPAAVPDEPADPDNQLLPPPPRVLVDAPRFALTDQTGAAFGSADLCG